MCCLQDAHLTFKVNENEGMEKMPHANRNQIKQKEACAHVRAHTHTHTSNIGALELYKTNVKGSEMEDKLINCNTLKIRDLNTPFSAVGVSFREKISNETHCS